MNVVWILFLTAVVAGAQSLLFSWCDLKGLSYRRFFSRTRVYEGESVEMVEELKNRKPLPVPWLRAESRISPYLRFGNQKQSEREISADQYHKSVFFLGPFKQVTRRHAVQCLKRGFYDVGSVALTAGDLLNLSQKSRQLHTKCTLTVYPRLLSEEELGVPSTRWQGEMRVKRWIMPDPFLTAGIRDYRAGDPTRDIHWRATARTGQLQVKVRDYTADPRVLVILNVQTSEEQWGELMDYEMDEIEQGIRMAATLCLRALESGVEAGFACNGCLIGEKGQKKPVIVLPKNAAGQGEWLLETMARLLAHREINFPTFLEELHGVSGQDILILSAYDSDLIRARMRQLEAMGNSVSLVRLEGRGEHARGA